MKNDLLTPLTYMALLFVLATLPGDAKSGDLMGVVPASLQNFAHVPAYGLLALLWIITFKNRGMTHQASLILAAFLASTYGALTEICQIWAQGRFPSLEDFLLDVAGIIIVACLHWME